MRVRSTFVTEKHEKYMSVVQEKINPFAADLYQYLNFDRISGFEDEGRVLSKEEEAKLIASV